MAPRKLASSTAIQEAQKIDFCISTFVTLGPPGARGQGDTKYPNKYFSSGPNLRSQKSRKITKPTNTPPPIRIS